jgi:hypothetical protein
MARKPSSCTMREWEGARGNALAVMNRPWCEADGPGEALRESPQGAGALASRRYGSAIDSREKKIAKKRE